jgi:hypothetical protein
MYDKRDMQAVEFRAIAGSFLWSTGPTSMPGATRWAISTLPMRNCTIALDGRVVVKTAFCKESLPDEPDPHRHADERYCRLLRHVPRPPRSAEAMRKINEMGPALPNGPRRWMTTPPSRSRTTRDLAERGSWACRSRWSSAAGASMGEYAMVGAEIGKYCGATALTSTCTTRRWPGRGSCMTCRT